MELKYDKILQELKWLCREIASELSGLEDLQQRGKRWNKAASQRIRLKVQRLSNARKEIKRQLMLFDARLGRGGK